MDTPEEIAEKLAELQALQASGVNPRVAEIVKVGWPDPDGPIYYATALAADLENDEELIGQIYPATSIQRRFAGNVFLALTRDSGIADDKVELPFSDLDDEISRLFQVHGEGARVEIFYWFQDVELLYSEWWGHLRPPDSADRENLNASAQSGFMSAMLPLPRRAFFTGCQALFGGLLKTQAEIDEGDCPYSLHLSGVPSSRMSSDTTWKQTQVFTAGWETPGFDDSDWAAAVDEGALGGEPWGERASFPVGSTAHWIWHTDSRGVLGPADATTVYFRRTFVADAAQALLVATADDSFIAYLDGVQVLTGIDWKHSTSAFLDQLIPGNEYLLAFSVDNSGGGPGGLVAEVAYNVLGVGFGNLDPATGLPYTSCPRNNRQVCIDRLEPEGSWEAPSYLGFDTIRESYVVHETKGPNISVTSRGNENYLTRPLRVIAGQRHVSDLDVMAFVVEPDTKHPEQGSARVLNAVCEGPIESMGGCKINGNPVGAMHLNIRLGERRQQRTAFSDHISNYSGTALFNGVTQGDFSKAMLATAGQNTFQSECDVEGLRDVRVYRDAVNYSEEYSADRAWWLMHILRNKRWGFGLDIDRLVIEDFIEASNWFAETVSIVDSDGNRSTGVRSSFHAELIGRTAQQQINDLCSAGRLGLPFPDRGKLRVVPLRREPAIFSTSIFTDRAFWGALDRAATDAENAAWLPALETARAAGSAALLAEGQTRLEGLFNSAEYAARARTDEEFVSDLYQAYVNRPPDTNGAVFWLDQVTTNGRAAVLVAFGESDEFVQRMQDRPLPTFTDVGTARNICVGDKQKSTLTWSEQSDADLPNRWVVTFDDAEHDNQQIPLTFEDPLQQLAAGRAFGDFTKRSVERQFSAFGVTDAGEAARLGNTLLALGELDEGGIENNLRATFTTWWSFAVTLHKYQVIKIESVDKFHERSDGRRFDYFRILSLKRMPDLRVEISAQAYPVEFYEQLELITVPPEIPPSPIDDNPGGGPGDRPRDIGFEVVDHTDDRIHFKLAPVGPPPPPEPPSGAPQVFDLGMAYNSSAGDYQIIEDSLRFDTDPLTGTISSATTVASFVATLTAKYIDTAFGFTDGKPNRKPVEFAADNYWVDVIQSDTLAAETKVLLGALTRPLLADYYADPGGAVPPVSNPNWTDGGIDTGGVLEVITDLDQVRVEALAYFLDFDTADAARFKITESFSYAAAEASSVALAGLKAIYLVPNLLWSRIAYQIARTATPAPGDVPAHGDAEQRLSPYEGFVIPLPDGTTTDAGTLTGIEAKLVANGAYDSAMASEPARRSSSGAVGPDYDGIFEYRQAFIALTNSTENADQWLYVQLRGILVTSDKTYYVWLRDATKPPWLYGPIDADALISGSSFDHTPITGR